MNAYDKEKVYEELRNYHTDKFPETINNPEVNDLRTRFVVMEDKVVMMAVRIVNDKEEYVDVANELQNFETRLSVIPAFGKDKPVKDLFAVKIHKLIGIALLVRDLDLASKGAQRII